MTNSSSLRAPQNLSHLVQRLSGSEQRFQQKRQAENEQEAQAEALADKLWPMMADMYGHKFVSQYGETPPDTWVKCLKGISGRQIADGLNTCITESPEWPPSAPHFRMMCLGVPTDSKGKELAHRAGMYSTKPPESVRNRQRARLEDHGVRHKRKVAAEAALSEMRGLFDED